jgi:hypothetical protein
MTPSQSIRTTEKSQARKRFFTGLHRRRDFCVPACLRAILFLMNTESVTSFFYVHFTGGALTSSIVLSNAKAVEEARARKSFFASIAHA